MCFMILKFSSFFNQEITGQAAKDYAKYDNHKRIVYEIYAFDDICPNHRTDFVMLYSVAYPFHIIATHGLHEAIFLPQKADFWDRRKFFTKSSQSP